MATNNTIEATCKSNVTHTNITQPILRYGSPFDRNKCLAPSQYIFEFGPKELQLKYFVFNKVTGEIEGTREDIYLNPTGCNEICGNETGWNADSASRLSKWFLPIIILLANFQFSPVGRKRYLSIAHLVGDPIDSTSSLCLKMERWKESFAEAQDRLGYSEVEFNPIYGCSWLRRRWRRSNKARLYETKSLGIMIDAVKEVCGYLQLPIDMEADFDSIFGDINDPEAKKQIAEAAQDIMGTRTYDIRQTILAIILYLYQVLAEFIKALGAGPGPSGGQLGPGLLLSWILPNVLLSNILGVHVSEDSCLNIVAKFLEARHALQGRIPSDPQNPIPDSKGVQILNRCLKPPENYHADLICTGAMNTIYLKPREFQISDWRRVVLYIVSSFPVLIAFSCSFAVLYTPPSFFSCRHRLIIGIFVSWIISPMISFYILYQPRQTRNPNPIVNNINNDTPSEAISITTLRRQFWLITIKDLIITIVIIIMLILSTVGIFNNCTCWIGFHRSDFTARINPKEDFDHNIDFLYPRVVYSCLALQGAVFTWFCWVGGSGLRMMWWNGKDGRMWVERTRETAERTRETAERTRRMREREVTREREKRKKDKNQRKIRARQLRRQREWQKERERREALEKRALEADVLEAKPCED